MICFYFLYDDGVAGIRVLHSSMVWYVLYFEFDTCVRCRYFYYWIYITHRKGSFEDKKINQNTLKICDITLAIDSHTLRANWNCEKFKIISSRTIKYFQHTFRINLPFERRILKYNGIGRTGVRRVNGFINHCDVTSFNKSTSCLK